MINEPHMESHVTNTNNIYTHTPTNNIYSHKRILKIQVNLRIFCRFVCLIFLIKQHSYIL